MKTTHILSIAAVALCIVTSAPAAHAAITSQLDFGAQGSNVTQLQSYLAGWPSLYPSGLVTGYFGELTQGGVQKFQTTQSIVSEGTPESTGYGRVGPITLAHLHMMIDPYAPLMYAFKPVVSTNAATIIWATSEPAYNRVMYSTSWPFVYDTAPSVSMSGLSGAVKITLTGLKSNTTYYFVRESVDAWGNKMLMEHESFKTK